MPFRRRGFAQRRKTLGFSQERFAEQLGVERSTVVRWERGETEPQPWLRPRIARTLEVSLEKLDDLLAEVDDAEATIRASRRGQPGATMALHTSAMQAFRAADCQVGGGHLYATVIDYPLGGAATSVSGEWDTRPGGPHGCRGTERHGRMDGTRCRRRCPSRAPLCESPGFVRMGADAQLGAQVDASM